MKTQHAGFGSNWPRMAVTLLVATFVSATLPAQAQGNASDGDRKGCLTVRGKEQSARDQGYGEGRSTR